MQKMRKCLVIVLALVMVLGMMSVGVNAATASERNIPWISFGLRLNPYGTKHDAGHGTKSMDTDFANVQEITISTSNPNGVWLRIRENGTGNAATDAKQLFDYDSGWLPLYIDGYGDVGDTLFIRGQTPSTSAYTATVTGIWVP